MWLFCKSGIYSVVEHRDGPEWLLVRCRTEHDAQALVYGVGAIRRPGTFPIPTVEEDPTADYRWRVKVLRSDFDAFIGKELQNLHYTTNVKGNIDQGDPLRHEVLLSCWSALQRLQVAPPAPLPDDEYVSADLLEEWLVDHLGNRRVGGWLAEALLEDFEMYRIDPTPRLAQAAGNNRTVVEHRGPS